MPTRIAFLAIVIVVVRGFVTIKFVKHTWFAIVVQ